MLQHASTSDFKIKAGKPPKQTPGYLAPSVGSFTLHGGRDGGGDAAFVWNHGCHPVFGDRGCELTVIGTARDRAVFLEDLRKRLCTDEEVRAGQRRQLFPDPWPKTFCKI